ncbi:hypothetical protein TVAG_041570 [Trichomonas vaginalis G3]|uniref:Uncharacterized protein n=1 Tax=Trichomonas vaginalis (strain ATCC PRA-98 / G3) TaxID=412133 RepID=A2FEV1_TRIV3|nr:hypothetical protein TVAGG3_0702580 [Trichomonas vaginalis G3]EAX96555.1 hypothetical protein TVAG_041570 [Trichomonas vaginalis G3]KAI5509334.1 hypothetical protein TVAGG3_0702580 [Trichomonas vaginalis G3]|eukprot:XP_001309485.1 hypothetical protein [Trichomonas vaginalis G3]
MEYYEQIPFLISIPLYPDPSSPYDKLYGLPHDMIPVQTNSTNLTFSTTFLSGYSSNVDLYLFHNFWGYNFELQATDSTGRIVLDTDFSLNQNLSNPQKSNISRSLLLNNPIKIYGKDIVEIFCPYETQITDKLGLNSTSQLIFANINPNVSSLHLGSYNFKTLSNDLSFTFTNFTAYPYDYVSIPQAYITGYRETNKKNFLITGPTLFVIFVILFFVTIFLAYVSYE